jgi:hypothetical protein
LPSLRMTVVWLAGQPETGHRYCASWPMLVQSSTSSQQRRSPVPEQRDHAQPTIPVLSTGAPEVVVDHPSKTGEGPLWHEDAQRVYWVDIPAGKLFRYDPESGVNELVYTHDAQIGGYTVQHDGSLVLFCSQGKILRLIGNQTEVIIPEIEKERAGRFNDVIADPEGKQPCPPLSP